MKFKFKFKDKDFYLRRALRAAIIETKINDDYEPIIIDHCENCGAQTGLESGDYLTETSVGDWLCLGCYGDGLRDW